MVRKVNKMRKSARPEMKMYTMDQLAWMTDDDLVSLMMHLDREREQQAVARGRNPYQWEVELSYVLREIDIRHARKAAHVKWLQSMGAEVSNARSN